MILPMSVKRIRDAGWRRGIVETSPTCWHDKSSGTAFTVTRVYKHSYVVNVSIIAFTSRAVYLWISLKIYINGIMSSSPQFLGISPIPGNLISTPESASDPFNDGSGREKFEGWRFSVVGRCAASIVSVVVVIVLVF